MGSNNPFWDYAIWLYGEPGMAQQCLQLQDQYAIDVDLLLWVIWQASREVVVDAATLAQADRLIAPWREHCVAPMRQLRRQLKTMDTSGDLYRQAKALELALEHEQQQRLFAYSQRLMPAPKPAALNFASCLQLNLRHFLALQPALPEALRDSVLAELLAQMPQH
jgi:uncharacterized protein (TIGR02444 family)